MAFGGGETVMSETVELWMAVPINRLKEYFAFCGEETAHLEFDRQTTAEQNCIVRWSFNELYKRNPEISRSQHLAVRTIADAQKASLIRLFWGDECEALPISLAVATEMQAEHSAAFTLASVPMPSTRLEYLKAAWIYCGGMFQNLCRVFYLRP
jgi:hypothetical protein